MVVVLEELEEFDELELVVPLVVPLVEDFVEELDEDPLPDLSRLTVTFAWAPFNIIVPP